MVYAFRGGKDGAEPSGPLLWVSGAFYGTTYAGGSHGCGTAFRLSASASERIVYSFKYGRDGCAPEGGLVAIEGVLYGVTGYGGDSVCDCGTVFKLSTSGIEQVIHRFKGGGDGNQPLGSLITIKGVLYGTTFEGGDTPCGFSGRGCGTVFRITTSGAERLLYGFKGGTDGELPQAGLLALRRTLYGTISAGGNNYCGPSSFLPAVPSSRSCRNRAYTNTWLQLYVGVTTKGSASRSASVALRDETTSKNDTSRKRKKEEPLRNHRHRGFQRR